MEQVLGSLSTSAHSIQINTSQAKARQDELYVGFKAHLEQAQRLLLIAEGQGVEEAVLLAYRSRIFESKRTANSYLVPNRAAAGGQRGGHRGGRGSNRGNRARPY